MCGLVGAAGALVFKDELTTRRLLLFDYFRGPDATGLAAIRSNGDAVISKLASDPIDIFGLKSFTDALNGSASRAFIGHNRAATRGKNISVNAHPFQFGHIIGAHNGTLTYKSVQRLEEAVGEKFEVDSMALFAAIEKLGVEKAIKLCTEGEKEQEGAWALVWFDQNEGTLNFLRNKWRPLYFCYEKTFKRMFWASEDWMLMQALKDYELYVDDKGFGFFYFRQDTHYKFDLNLLATSGNRPKPKTKEIKGRDPESDKYVPMTGQRESPFGMSRTQVPTICGIPSTTVTNPRSKTSTMKSRSKPVIQLIADKKHPYANIIDEGKFKPMASEGCTWCGTKVKYGEPGVTIYERDGALLCRTCSGYPEDLVNPPVKLYVRESIFDTLNAA